MFYVHCSFWVMICIFCVVDFTRTKLFIVLKQNEQKVFMCLQSIQMLLYDIQTFLMNHRNFFFSFLLLEPGHNGIQIAFKAVKPITIIFCNLYMQCGDIEWIIRFCDFEYPFHCFGFRVFNSNRETLFRYEWEYVQKTWHRLWTSGMKKSCVSSQVYFTTVKNICSM